MNKIEQAFLHEKAFIPYITGGDPDIETSEKLLYALHNAGANIIEIGVPFSDPIAEGPVIEQANQRALKAGCTVDWLFELVERVRAKIDVPIVFMTYYNPVFVYGNNKFAKHCAECGVDGLIIPDLPFEERDELYEQCNQNEITLISLIAPTSKSRIARIASASSGFLYCVSSLGVTGERHQFDDSAKLMIEQVRNVSSIPCCVGFGISTAEQARQVANYADGVIIGSSFVKVIAKYGRDSVDEIWRLGRKIRQAINENKIQK
ncbi:MAG: tryptophan synthase subunit alpha [Dehalococcoidia bacterium]|nr:tryptophan synthase subunit alpha [Dehalococcoidia bacterium]